MSDILDKILPRKESEEIEIGSISLLELMMHKYPDTQWLVERLIPNGGITAISGAPASFKTWIMLHLAITVASGGILFDKFVTKQTGVLLIDEENGEPLLQKRLHMLLRNTYDLPIEVSSLAGVKLTEGLVRKYITFCEEKNIKLIIFDSLIRIHNTDENDAKGMSGVADLLKQFNKSGITVIFTHHNRKQGMNRSNPSQEMRGSSDILASVDCHIAIGRKDDSVQVTQTKSRYDEEIKEFGLKVVKGENTLEFEYMGEIDKVQTKKGDMRQLVITILKESDLPRFKQEIFSELKKRGVDGGHSTFKKVMSGLVEDGEVFEQRGERNKVYCSIKPLKTGQGMSPSVNE